ncbi:MAG: PEPxxWA-CTERM sorting domain-containing protein [Novosphingobium sp.]|nr:PEPxxWA-CTERM sorting domain-containing protein [Novosphingobium sp.]
MRLIAFACAAASLAATLIGTAPAAATTVITFDSQATTGFVNQYGPTYQEGDLTFATLGGSSFGLLSFGPSFSADPAGATIALNAANDWLVITRTGGGAFDLASLALADGFNSGTAGNIAYTLVTGSGTTNGVFALDAAKGLQTYNLNWGDVLSLSIKSNSPMFQLDDVTYSPSVASPSVPEPATWAMLLAGFGLVGGALRRRGFERRRVVVA